MGAMNDIDILLEWMASKSVNGTFQGSPQKLIDRLGNEKSLHEKLAKLGVTCIGNNGTETWIIPASLLKKLGK
jgi:hypothetical protein